MELCSISMWAAKDMGKNMSRRGVAALQEVCQCGGRVQFYDCSREVHKGGSEAWDLQGKHCGEC